MRKNANSFVPFGARKLVLGVLATGAFFVGYTQWVSPTQAAPAPKVEICHIPSGNPANFHTIKVGENAVPAHLAHGDALGACNDLCAWLCDDGNVCTIDDTGDCEEQGCPTSREEVDCDDTNPCTTDWCDPVEACVNEPEVGASCDDGATCTGPDICNAQGVCGGPSIENCCLSAAECSQNLCDQAYCDLIINRCVEDPVVCMAPDLCTSSQCNPTTGDCEETPVVCIVPDACTESACLLANGLCVEELVDCDDGDACTAETCDPALGCAWTPVVCAPNQTCDSNAGGCVDLCFPAPDDLVAWWTFDADGTDIQNGLGGTLINGAAAGAPGQVAGALSLDGIDDYSRTLDSVLLTTPNGITVDAWVYTSDLSAGQVIAAKYISLPVEERGWAFIALAGGGFRFVVYDGNNQFNGVDTELGALTENTWHFVAASFDLATQTTVVYVDGVEVPALPVPGAVPIAAIGDTNSPVDIGVFTGSLAGGALYLTGFWSGLIDEVEIFNRALDATEIQGIYNAGAAGKCKN